MAMPPCKIDLKTLEQLATIHCTVDEAAAVLGICERTLYRQMKKAEIKEVWERGKGKGRASLRRLQWKAAQGGSTAMLIWLGKQMLGQRDIPIVAGDEPLPTIEIKVIK
jgi:hypothetical protein